MANTYTQLLIQIIFVVKGRQNLISEIHRVQVEKYICGIISKNGSKPLAIYCNPDHCHVLIGLNPSNPISNLVRSIKANASKWINDQKWIRGKFSWQNGYAAFSYSRSQLDRVVQYIHNQPNHHRHLTFKEEYIELLSEFDIQFDQQYLFEFI